ncbi:uncharacterized protein EMH_0034560 [Eimeria mitis]|uniref:Uncharacterized protein n=1 Tax=Eimeria mitis TaxID=44415 RepID=U6JSF8_9EIME|nr:uncharacterized protein EMH_0034560 [Eimeria mitis]CDJ27761.1 hypothetical protein, conserved [Eimeria mitis]
MIIGFRPQKTQEPAVPLSGFADCWGGRLCAEEFCTCLLVAGVPPAGAFGGAGETANDLLLAAALFSLCVTPKAPGYFVERSSRPYSRGSSRGVSSGSGRAAGNVNEAAFEEGTATGPHRSGGSFQRSSASAAAKLIHTGDRSTPVIRADTSKSPRRAVRHRALVLAVVVAIAVVVRGVHIGLSSRKWKGNAALSKRLKVWMELIEVEKDKLAELKTSLSEQQSANDQKEGLLQSQRLHIEQQEKLLRDEEEELMEKENKMQLLRNSLEKIEREAKRTPSMLFGREKQFLFMREPAGSQAAKKFRPMARDADIMQRIDEEFGAFDDKPCKRTSKEGSLFLDDHMELKTMQAASAVLKALPKRPSTPEEAKDIVRARRMLLEAVVRCQAATWAAITRLLQVKGEWLTEIVLEQSGKEGIDRLRAAEEEEWRMQKQQQDRARQELKELDESIQLCIQKQEDLQQRIASSETLGREALNELERQRFQWENYEITVRAQRALIMSTEAVAFTTREAFLKKKAERLERAFDRQAERRRRLPNDSLRLTELDTALMAISGELDELKSVYDMARDLKDADEFVLPPGATVPVMKGDLDVERIAPSEFEERRRTCLYSRPIISVSAAEEKPGSSRFQKHRRSPDPPQFRRGEQRGLSILAPEGHDSQQVKMRKKGPPPQKSSAASSGDGAHREESEYESVSTSSDRRWTCSDIVGGDYRVTEKGFLRVRHRSVHLIVPVDDAGEFEFASNLGSMDFSSDGVDGLSEDEEMAEEHEDRAGDVVEEHGRRGGAAVDKGRRRAEDVVEEHGRRPQPAAHTHQTPSASKSAAPADTGHETVFATLVNFSESEGDDSDSESEEAPPLPPRPPHLPVREPQHPAGAVAPKDGEPQRVAPLATDEDSAGTEGPGPAEDVVEEHGRFPILGGPDAPRMPLPLAVYRPDESTDEASKDSTGNVGGLTGDDIPFADDDDSDENGNPTSASPPPVPTQESRLPDEATAPKDEGEPQSVVPLATDEDSSGAEGPRPAEDVIEEHGRFPISGSPDAPRMPLPLAVYHPDESTDEASKDSTGNVGGSTGDDIPFADDDDSDENGNPTSASPPPVPTQEPQLPAEGTAPKDEDPSKDG